MKNDEKHEFIMTVQRDGASVDEIWHVCPRGKANDAQRRMEPAPRAGEQVDCDRCGSSWPR